MHKSGGSWYPCRRPKMTLFLAVLASLICCSFCVDLTLSPEADGQVVVDAVVERIRSNCIFGDDRLFLRRLAYVETEDGEDSKTYRPGYHGGIWQVDKNVFKSTKRSRRVSGEIARIKSALNIDWRKVAWKDLRKPLYSGLAAALYIKSKGPNLPNNLHSQAIFWVRNMRPNKNKNYFMSKSHTLPGSGCESEVDLAFIIDGSGSVSKFDFVKMLRFLNRVINKVDIGKKDFKVAVVEYGSAVGDVIRLNSHKSKQSLLRAVSNIRKSNSGTSTALAIQETVGSVFQAANGARANAKKVAILITDGQSNNSTGTIQAAKDAKNKGIVMFTVGVGNAYLPELRAAASKPSCTHMFILNTFVEIDSLLYSLKESSCGAPKVMPEGSQVTDKDLPDNTTVSETYVVPGKPTGTTGSGGTNGNGNTAGKKQTVVICKVKYGTLEIYASYSTTRPGPAFYEIKDSAKDGQPSRVYLNGTLKGKPLYLTVIGAKLPNSANLAAGLKASYNISIKTVPMTRVLCLEGKKEKICTKDDLRASQYRDMLCDESWKHIPNKCQRGTVTNQAHPADLTKFVRCDVTGKMFITQCPGQETYNPNTETCGHKAVAATPTHPANLTNYCTANNLARGDFFYSYKNDPLRYVQCDVWGNPWLKTCAPGLVWNGISNSCIHPPKTTFNPCNGKNNGQLFPASNKQKYIICNHGNPLVMACPPKLVFKHIAGRCVYP